MLIDSIIPKIRKYCSFCKMMVIFKIVSTSFGCNRYKCLKCGKIDDVGKRTAKNLTYYD